MAYIRRATPDDAAWLQASFPVMGWAKPDGYFATCCQLQDDNQIVLLVAADGDSYRGHVKVVWTPTYAYFRDNAIPEIQDLSVLPAHRRLGIATLLLDAAENLIRQRSPIAGIGFALYSDYGAAQRMYVLRGYVPDGNGVVYREEYAPPGEQVTVDDDLILYLTKSL